MHNIEGIVRDIVTQSTESRIGHALEASRVWDCVTSADSSVLHLKVPAIIDNISSVTARLSGQATLRHIAQPLAHAHTLAAALSASPRACKRIETCDMRNIKAVIQDLTTRITQEGIARAVEAQRAWQCLQTDVTPQSVHMPNMAELYGLIDTLADRETRMAMARAVCAHAVWAYAVSAHNVPRHDVWECLQRALTPQSVHIPNMDELPRLIHALADRETRTAIADAFATQKQWGFLQNTSHFLQLHADAQSIQAFLTNLAEQTTLAAIRKEVRRTKTRERVALRKERKAAQRETQHKPPSLAIEHTDVNTLNDMEQAHDTRKTEYSHGLQ